MRIIFMGTPEFSVTALKALIRSDHDVIAVYSQPPKPSGRGQRLQKTPVHICAETHDIPVFTPKSLRSEDEKTAFSGLNADIAIVAAYGLILPQAILDAPKFGCVNIHASLLPKWRGAAPIQRSIENGDTESGITLMQMDIGLDTGDMLSKDITPITNTTTGQGLHDALSTLGATMLISLLDQHPNWSPIPQDHITATYAHKLKKSDSHLDFSMTAQCLDQKIRALTPWPGTSFSWADKTIKVIKAAAANSEIIADLIESADLQTPFQSHTIYCLQKRLFIGCGDATLLELFTLQAPSKKPMDARDFLNGNAMKTGDIVHTQKS